jgi:hypothetical protein
MSRVIIRIELRPEAKKMLDDLCEKAGMTQVSLMSRLVEWVAEQPEIIQAAILGHYPDEIKQDLAKLILRHMQGKKVV